MSNNQLISNHQLADDEIDLAELFQILWNGKWLVSAFIIGFLCLGIICQQAMTPKYKVSTLYQINFHSLSDQQFCELGSNTGCLISRSVDSILSKLNSIHAMSVEDEGWQWSSKNKQFDIVTENLLSVEEYISFFNSISSDLTQEIKDRVELELSFINSEFSHQLQSTERVATNVLNAKRILHSIENGERAVEFSMPLAKPTKSALLIFTIFALLGAILGSIFVLLRHAFFNGKTKASI